MSVIFRRIRGHLVPIHTTDRQWEGAAGAGIAAAGVGAGVATGKTAAKLVQKASKMYVKSRSDFRTGKKLVSGGKAGQISFTEFLNARKGAKLVKSAVSMRKEAVSLFRTRNVVLGAGVAVSGALVGAGFSKLREAVSGKKSEGITEGSKTAAAVGATAALATFGSYYHHLPVGSLARVLTNTVARSAGKARPFKAKWWK